MDDQWYANDNFCRNGYPFNNLINAIRNFCDDKILKEGKEHLWCRNMVIAASANQFEIQEILKYKYYRYNYIFSYIDSTIDMKLIFKEKFKSNYHDFVVFVNCILIIATAKKIPNKYEFINYICFMYNHIVSKLTLPKEKFEEKIKFFSNNYEDCKNCVKVCNIYPFIHYKDKLYLTLIHSLIIATTKSLFLRLTDKDNKLKEKIGKSVIESYLYDVVLDSGEFDEVLKEQVYGKENKKTADLLCRKGEKVLFFECKSATPFAHTRCLDEKLIEKETLNIVSYMSQLYKQMTSEFLKGKYYCFSKKIDVNKDMCYGIVCIFDESNISRKYIYERFAKEQKIPVESLEYKWIINHIKICSLYKIERYVFTKNEILNAIIDQELSETPYDFPLENQKFEKNMIQNEKVLCMNKMIIKECGNIIKKWYLKK